MWREEYYLRESGMGEKRFGLSCWMEQTQQLSWSWSVRWTIVLCISLSIILCLQRLSALGKVLFWRSPRKKLHKAQGGKSLSENSGRVVRLGQALREEREESVWTSPFLEPFQSQLEQMLNPAPQGPSWWLSYRTSSMVTFSCRSLLKALVLICQMSENSLVHSFTGLAHVLFKQEASSQRGWLARPKLSLDYIQYLVWTLYFQVMVIRKPYCR